MPAFPVRSGRHSIGLAAASYLELGLAALRDGNQVRAVGCFASIDDSSWAAICARFPALSELITNLEATR
jgi:hypothetical protein